MSATRRQFLKSAAIATAAATPALRSLNAWAAVDHLTYGVQIYELRKQAETDLAGALKTIHDAGFSQVELYPVAYRKPAADVRRMVHDAGLGCVSGHFDYGSDNMTGYARDLGLEYIVCPMLPKDQWSSPDGFLKAADYFNSWAEKAKTAGMQFVFHNHCYEFRPMGGQRGFDILMQHTDPALVKLEVDVFWLEQAGQDPAAILSEYASRAVLIHIKDRRKDSQPGYDLDRGGDNIVDLGKGDIKWKKILTQAKEQGIKYAYVDQDFTPGSTPGQSLRVAKHYLDRLNV